MYCTKGAAAMVSIDTTFSYWFHMIAFIFRLYYLHFVTVI